MVRILSRRFGDFFETMNRVRSDSYHLCKGQKQLIDRNRIKIFEVSSYLNFFVINWTIEFFVTDWVWFDHDDFGVWHGCFNIFKLLKLNLFIINPHWTCYTILIRKSEIGETFFHP